MKKCSHCKEIKAFSDFSPSKQYRHGVASRCKACQAAIMKKRRDENPDIVQAEYAQRKEYRQSPQGQAWWHAYYEANKEKIALYQHEWHIAHKEEIAQKAAAYYQATKEQRDAYNEAWRKAHPQQWTAISKRSAANKRNAPINDLTQEQWEEIQAAYQYRCYYCEPDCKECKNGTHELTQDHVIPPSKGGENSYTNIVPACRSCNAKKNAGPPPIPVQTLLLTIAPSKPRRANRRRNTSDENPAP